MRLNVFFWLKMKVWDRLWKTIINWLNHEKDDIEIPPSDFKQLCYEIRPGDVILVEGRSRISDVIKLITQSPWTHSALYIGHIYELKDNELRQQVEQFYDGHPDSPLIIEALLGEGTVVHTLYKYRHDHVRICRPTGIRPYDARKVIKFAIKKLGSEYHVRQLLDLARFMFPYSFLPRRWRSTLFLHNAGSATQTVCSTMISEAFQSIKFPILPVRRKLENGQVSLYVRNPKLVTPKDFDYSPYFEIIKYPIFGFDKAANYQKMPWNEDGLICHEPGNCYLPDDALEPLEQEENILRQQINLLRFKQHKQVNTQVNKKQHNSTQYSDEDKRETITSKIASLLSV